MFSIQIKQYSFKTSLIPSAVTIILFYIMISLGFWQLDRADYKSNLQTLIESKQGTESIPLNSLANDEKDWLYQPVYAIGEFDQQHQIFLDNQVNDMVAGYTVFTPLKISENEGILVNRGWVALGKSRSKLPNISIETNTLRIDGLAAHAPSKGLVLSDNVNIFNQWPVVLQYIDITDIEKELNYKLLPKTIIMDKKQITSLKPVPIKINMRSEKHTAYAFQWFGLSLTLFIIYIIVNTTNTKKD